MATSGVISVIGQHPPLSHLEQLDSVASVRFASYRILTSREWSAATSWLEMLTIFRLPQRDNARINRASSVQDFFMGFEQR